MSESILNKLKKFRYIIRKSISTKSQIILFGSFAKGKNKKWSDIDVAIVLPKVNDRIKMEIDLRLKSLSIDERINPFVFSSNEFKQNSPLIWEIKKYGQEIN